MRTVTVALGLLIVQGHIFGRTASGIIIGRVTDLRGELEEGPTLRTVGEDAAAIAAIFENRPPPPSGPTPHLANGKPDLSGMWLNEPPDFSGIELLP